MGLEHEHLPYTEMIYDIPVLYNIAVMLFSHPVMVQSCPKRDSDHIEDGVWEDVSVIHGSDIVALTFYIFFWPWNFRILKQ